MDRFNSLCFVFLLLSVFAVSVSAIVSPDHVVVVSTLTDRNSTTTTSSSEEEDYFDLLKNAEHHFTNFVKKYGKTYADEQEHAYRLSVFKSNLRRAKRHQKLDPTAVHGITQYSDLTLMEFKRNFLGGGGFGVKRVKLLENNVGGNATILPTSDLPADFDWRDRGVVSSVKDQGSCWSSYAFSALGAIEGAYALATGKSVDLSEQEVIDCTYRKYSGGLNDGCSGGSLLYVFEHVRNKGFMRETQYPYVSGRTRRHGPCLINVSNITAGRVANLSVVNSGNEDQIAANLVKNGPLAVIIKMNEPALFSTYVGGVSCPLICSTKFSYHAVVLVGYGAGAYSPTRLKKEPYWILKNSFGKNWGEKGYFRTCRGNDDACGRMKAVYSVATTDGVMDD